MSRLKTNWVYAITLGALVWLRLALVSAADNAVPVNIVNPNPLTSLTGWDASINNIVSGGLVILVVKWFMSHIEQQSVNFLKTIEAKDKAYHDLAAACRAEHQAIIEYLTREKGEKS